MVGTEVDNAAPAQYFWPVRRFWKPLDSVRPLTSSPWDQTQDLRPRLAINKAATIFSQPGSQRDHSSEIPSLDRRVSSLWIWKTLVKYLVTITRAVGSVGITTAQDGKSMGSNLK
ncbi:hypothetical protein PoB_003905400 [Plakobranchus ocellatus]|uniref:Uncharacterized protein n=1 Tax=Plakobranchus ocellatus TaxID=259542 RepID=A0AAV4B1I2_9GAST|nr:hypothetical protein PoB_003905400 [Plakobranchus ocellatus]